ncbi:hypothetical protein CXF68_01995 [Tenacibaculum sp. Bg11-29]|uniref:hypothetical protein n=1 Tax=Tenacibaculum sp. Bg11-29 TaxID=2058306 RepID=UPI000C33CB17|nr:hypothetical protein [Tenacibaculum sp. Bg11-29]PKH49535.1 hypothetical protein CXF68_01995 [Tenacibaculum sp. Bg11-29]
MNKFLNILLIFISINLYSQDSIGLKVDSLTNEKKLIQSDTIIKRSSQKVDTITLNFKNELTIPISKDNLTKVVMVKEKTKVDWLKYLLPILTLLLGIWVKGIIEKRSDKKKIIKSGERWIAELRSLEEPIKKQIQSLDEYSEELKKEDFKIRNLELYSSLSGEVFKSLDKNELIIYIELNNKKKVFEEIVKISNSTNGYVSILEHLYETLREKFNRYLSGTSKHTTSLSLSLQEFSSAFKDYGVELEKESNSDPLNDPRYIPIADLHSAQIMPYLRAGNFNPFVLRREFFLPLVEIMAHLRLDPRTKGIASAMTKGLNAIKGIELEKDYMSKNLESIIKQYKGQLTELEKLINKI